MSAVRHDEVALQLWQMATVVRRHPGLGHRYRAQLAGMAIDAALIARGRQPIGPAVRLDAATAAAVLTETLRALEARGADWDNLMAAASRHRLGRPQS